MARGTMYELQREKDFLNQLQEEELYEHLPDIAEFVKTEKNKEKWQKKHVHQVCGIAFRKAENRVHT